jgi:MFS family permease
MLVAQTLLAALLATLMFCDSVGIWQLALILAVNRVCVTFEMPSRQVMLYQVVGRAHLMNAIALNSGLFNASRVMGPALAGGILAAWGATACFALNAVSFMAAIVAVATIRIRPRAIGEGSDPEPSSSNGRESPLLGGLAYLRNHRRVGAVFGMMMAFGLVGMGYQALVPAYAQKVLHQGPQGYSLLLSSGGLGATLGALLVASLGRLERKERLAIAGVLIFAIALALAGVVPEALARSGAHGFRLTAGCGSIFIAGFGAILFYSTAQTLIQLAVPDALRGRIIGLWLIGFSASVPAGSLTAGWLGQRIGVERVMVVAALLCGLLALVMQVGGWLDEDRPAHHESGVADPAARSRS